MARKTIRFFQLVFPGNFVARPREVLVHQNKLKLDGRFVFLLISLSWRKCQPRKNIMSLNLNHQSLYTISIHMNISRSHIMCFVVWQ